MISRAGFEAYCRAVDAVTGAASEAARLGVAAWLAEHPDAGTGEAREAAIEILDGLVQVSDEAAATLAAQWYDELAEAGHAKLPAAVTETSYTREAVEEGVRFMAGRHAKGDLEGFARGCADLAADDARKSLNATIMRNARRDRKMGVRFARVPTGAETCAFCFMLAGRGAVYHTRETAGELGKFHHHCDCKVVPGFEAEPDAELVEGWRQAEARERLAQVERECGAKVGDEWSENDVVTRSMRLRDPDWLWHGKVPEPDYSLLSAKQKRRLTDNERSGHKLLADNGFMVQVLPTERSSAASIDMALGQDGELWELKSPTGTGERLHTRIDEGVSKWTRLHAVGDIPESKPKIAVDVRFCSMPDSEAERIIRERMAFWADEGFDEAILINHDGTIALIRK